jgi:hypothetical protein
VRADFESRCGICDDTIHVGEEIVCVDDEWSTRTAPAMGTEWPGPPLTGDSSGRLLATGEPATFLVEVRVAAPGFDDMDWTEPCLERGTTFNFDAPGMRADGIPVERAYVEDEMFVVVGRVRIEV